MLSFVPGLQRSACLNPKSMCFQRPSHVLGAVWQQDSQCPEGVQRQALLLQVWYLALSSGWSKHNLMLIWLSCPNDTTWLASNIKIHKDKCESMRDIPRANSASALCEVIGLRPVWNDGITTTIWHCTESGGSVDSPTIHSASHYHLRTAVFWFLDALVSLVLPVWCLIACCMTVWLLCIH